MRTFAVAILLTLVLSATTSSQDVISHRMTLPLDRTKALEERVTKLESDVVFLARLVSQLLEENKR